MDCNYIIIGSSAAGIGALKALVRLAPSATITCITAQTGMLYNTCFLADYCAGEKPLDALTILESSTLNDHVRLIQGVKITKIDTVQRNVIGDNGVAYAYDKLLIATGARPYIPAIKGLDGAQGVFTFHTLDDVQRLLAYCEQRNLEHAVVIGAGLSGLEAADALMARGVKVHVVERADRVLATAIDAGASAFIDRVARAVGVQFSYTTTVKEIKTEQQRVKSVVLDNGKELSADMVIIAAGVQQNTELVAGSGVEVSDCGIITDQHLQTTVPGIYAAGDVACVRDSVTGQRVTSTTWPDAMAQAMMAAYAMVGKPRPYQGVIPYVSSAFFGVKFAACGQTELKGGLSEKVSSTEILYRRLVLDENDVLKGCVLVGNALNVAPLKRAIATGLPPYSI